MVKNGFWLPESGIVANIFYTIDLHYTALLVERLVW